MKRFIVVLFLITLTVVNTEARELDIEFREQNTPVWCWAATIAMVVEYRTGQNLQDCEVLNKYDRSLGGQGLCCQGSMSCLRTGHLNEMQNIMRNLYRIDGSYINYPPSFQQLKNSIDNDKPLIASLVTHNGQSGHVVVVSGYTNDRKVIVLDPLKGKCEVKYETLMSNFTDRWVGSFIVGDVINTPNPVVTTPSASNRCVYHANGSHCFVGNGNFPINSPCQCFVPGFGFVNGLIK